MDKLLYFVLACYGLTNIVTTGTIAEPVRAGAARLHRKLGELLQCPMCFGFWAGLGISLLGYGPGHPLIDGFLASGACWLLFVLAGDVPQEET